MSVVTLKNLNTNDIMQYQQNRYPVLLIDRINEVIPGVEAEGIKAFTYNEWFFPGHFEDEPNVPGFVQMECLVQVYIMTFLTLPEYKGMKTNFFSINNTQFRRKIIPGDMLTIKATLDSCKRGVARGSANGFVDGEHACSADFIVTIPDVLNKFKPRT